MQDKLLKGSLEQRILRKIPGMKHSKESLLSSTQTDSASIYIYKRLIML